jgi:DNA recombination protein RmuC
MESMVIVSILLGVLVAVAAAATAYAYAMRRAQEQASTTADGQVAATAELRGAIDSAVHEAIAQVREQASAERDAAVTAALQQSAVLQREQLGSTSAQVHQQVNADLSAKKDVIDARLDQVHSEMRNELTKLSDMVSALGRTNAESFGSVTNSLQAHAEVANTLAESTRSLREALANPQVRGQWGERMAEDVLRLAGFHENINYVKQSQIEGGGRPDYTFPMPKGHALYMDVKFPMAAYLRYLEAGTNAERDMHLKRFLQDVRLRVKELAKRDYAGESEQPSVDYVLLFIPNEQLTGFIHEHDSALLDDAMGQQVVLCSPLTLFAFLGVIRQAFDNFMIEQTSDEILKLLGTFGAQWRKYADQVEGVKKRFDAVDKAFDQLAGTRRRQLERPLLQLEALRLQRGLPLDGQLFAADGDGFNEADEDTDTPPGGSLRALGA